MRAVLATLGLVLFVMTPSFAADIDQDIIDDLDFYLSLDVVASQDFEVLEKEDAQELSAIEENQLGNWQ